MTRLVQLRNAAGSRCAAVVDGELLRPILDFNSTYSLAQEALSRGVGLDDLVRRLNCGTPLAYGDIYTLQSEWRLLPAFDHPSEPARCLVSGTGLTHLASAQNRQAMHAATDVITDSMRMYLWGVEGGRPEPGKVGVPPEWFYKGCGTTLRGHGEPLLIPPYAGDGGEEPEIAGAYVIDERGRPHRVGFMIANEFSDHRTEKKNYLYLAPSKLRTCAVGPELVVGAQFQRVPGAVSIHRGGSVVWRKEILSGQENMSHSLANIEHHHFKFEQHRRPGDAHVHFFGADAFSFGAGIELQDGDVMQVAFEGMGRPLRNVLKRDAETEMLIEVLAL